MDRQEKNKEYGPGEISGKTDMNRNSLENKGKEQESPLEKHRLRRWQKVLAMVLALILVLVAGFAGSFFFLRAKGEKNLKTQVPETAESAPEEEREGIFVTYKGKEYKYNENIINFLCLGIDKDVPIEEKRTGDIEGLADAVLLASVDVEDGLVQLLAIPRDTIVPVKVMDSQGRFDRNENVQITMQYAYGRTAKESCELMTDTVSNLLFRLQEHFLPDRPH